MGSFLVVRLYLPPFVNRIYRCCLMQLLHVFACRLCPKDTYAGQRGAAKCTPCASPASSQFFVNDDGQKCFKPHSNAARTGCGGCCSARDAAVVSACTSTHVATYVV
jgi:hypothetical protein